MIIREALFEEHSRNQAIKVAHFACRSPKNFKELMDCFLERMKNSQ